MELPYSDASFDAVTVGFGVRNLADVGAGIREMTRVLKPGGRCVILEITQPQKPPLSTFFGIWFDRDRARARPRSRATPRPTRICPSPCAAFRRPRASRGSWTRPGSTEIRYTVLAGGIIAIHSGVRPA